MLTCSPKAVSTEIPVISESRSKDADNVLSVRNDDHCRHTILQGSQHNFKATKLYPSSYSFVKVEILE